MGGLAVCDERPEPSTVHSGWVGNQSMAVGKPLALRGSGIPGLEKRETVHSAGNGQMHGSFRCAQDDDIMGMTKCGHS
jgi:hypothetical protein